MKFYLKLQLIISSLLNPPRFLTTLLLSMELLIISKVIKAVQVHPEVAVAQENQAKVEQLGHLDPLAHRAILDKMVPLVNLAPQALQDQALTLIWEDYLGRSPELEVMVKALPQQ